jgi:hypothetical protein
VWGTVVLGLRGSGVLPFRGTGVPLFRGQKGLPLEVSGA